MLQSDEAGRVTGTVSLLPQTNRYWFAIAVDCQARVCPNISAAALTFNHPPTFDNGGQELCAASDSVTIGALKDAFINSWNALSLRDVLNVVGVSPLGVVILYATAAFLGLFSLLFLFWALKDIDPDRKQMCLHAYFAATISTVAYLTMATGCGLVVLRKSGTGPRAVWMYSNPLMAAPGDPKHPNPLYSEEYAKAPTYPIFFARYIDWLLTTPLVLEALYALVAAPTTTRQALLFSGLGMVGCSFLAATTTTAARWAFEALSVAFMLGAVSTVASSLYHLAGRRGKGCADLYGRLARVVCSAWLLYHMAWVLCEGGKILPVDAAVAIYAALDVLLKCYFFWTLLRRAPTPSARPAAGGGGVRRSEQADNDAEGAAIFGDLGDLEDNL